MTHHPSVSGRPCMLVLLGLVAVFAGPAIPASAQAGRSATPTLEALAARLKHFEDKEEITNILINYARQAAHGCTKSDKASRQGA